MRIVASWQAQNHTYTFINQTISVIRFSVGKERTSQKGVDRIASGE